MAVVIKKLICLDLPTAGLVIGYIGVFSGIWQLIEILLTIAYFDDYFDKNYQEKAGPEFRSIAYAVIFLMFIGCLLDLITSILLIRGTNTQSHKMLLPWLILKGIALAILIPVISLCFLVGIYSVFSGLGSKLFITSIVVIVVIVLFSYIYMVVYSLYYYIRDEIRKPRQIDSEALYSNSNVRYDKT